MQNTRSVLIIGAGIAGATVAESLSRAGHQVHLIEKQAAIGGHVTEMGCKATDSCLHCNICVANEVFRNVLTSKDINIHINTELIKLDHNSSGYSATLFHKPVFIDRGKCTGQARVV